MNHFMGSIKTTFDLRKISRREYYVNTLYNLYISMTASWIKILFLIAFICVKCYLGFRIRLFYLDFPTEFCKAAAHQSRSLTHRRQYFSSYCFLPSSDYYSESCFKIQAFCPTFTIREPDLFLKSQTCVM